MPRAAVAADQAGGPEHAAEQFLRRLLGDELWERLPERTRLARRAEGHALVAEMVDLQARAPWQAEDVTVPVVAGHGTRCPAAPHRRRSVANRADQGHGADGDRRCVAHGAHLSHPRAFAELVERTIERGRPSSE